MNSLTALKTITHTRFYRSPVLRTIVWIAVAFLIWYYSSKAIHDILVWGAFAAALPRARRAWPVWSNGAGIAFLGVLLFTLVTLPLSVDWQDSARDLLRLARLPAGAFAISVWLQPSGRLFAALVYSAWAITLVLAADLIRLGWALGDDLLSEAHAYEPFMLNHSNVSSMLAGLCFLVLATIPPLRRKKGTRIAAAIGMLVCLAYLFVLASRGPQIAFLITLFVAGLLWTPGWRCRAAWVLTALVAGSLAVWNMERLNPRFDAPDELTTFAGRTTVWEHTWELAQQRPWRGYGFGKRLFEEVYETTDPPTPPPPYQEVTYPHPHSYALFVLFQHGWPGVMLYACAWGLLAWRLLRVVWRHRNDAGRWLPGMVLLLLLYLHLYGLGDYPDNRLAIVLIWLVPVALVVTKE